MLTTFARLRAGACLHALARGLLATLALAGAASAATISGTVFEDSNYGGGAGRSLAASGGAPIPTVRMELYNAAGAFVSTQNTTAAGTFSFAGLGAGTYTVRAANRSIASTRGGCAAGTCLPVQTFRTNAATGVAVAVSDRVGGQNPTLLDSVNNTTAATLASLTTATTTPQSITSVALATGGTTVAGVDFGFSFDTIVNVNNTGQGSLRQFVTNANALPGEGALAQVGQTAGRETSIFMIPNGVANPGQNVGYANQLTVGGANGGAARITLTSALPAITGANTSLDARTQTANVRATAGGAETNPGQVGSGGTVGTSAIALPQFDRPEVVVNAAATQLSGTAASVTIRGLAVENGSIIVSGANSVVRDCLAGVRADGTVGTVYGTSYGITIGAGAGIAITHDFVRVNNSGIRGDAAGANAIIEFNEVDSITGAPGGGHTNTFDGILIINSATNITVRYNLAKNQRGGGLEFGFGAGSVTGTVTENTLTTNGYDSAGVPSTEALNVAFYSLAAATSLTFTNNVVTASGGPGVVVESTSGIVISQNSIFANGVATGLGIDLDPRGVDPNTYMPPQGPTLNDLNDADAGPNGQLNFPVIQSAMITGGNLSVTGWARPTSLIEFFVAAADPSGFGEGQTYTFTATEGSGADSDATSSAYGPGAINGVVQGNDLTNRFSFSVPTPGGVSVGTRLTATARLAGNTSEFSAFVIVTGFPSYTVTKLSSAVTDPANCATPGDSSSCSPPGSQKRIPGAVVEYAITTSNSGGADDANSLFVRDAMPANTSLRVADLSPGAGPVAFANGVTASGLTYTFVSLASATDDVEFSSDNGASWGYTPTPDAAGCDASVTNLRVNPKGTFVADSATPDPSFTLRFRVCVD